MADVDEDTIPRLGNFQEDGDLTDETQDFRFLANLSPEDAAIPKRGEKDFEPHATALQANTLAASRQAMHNALSFQRVHQPKGHTVAVYHPETNTAYVDNPKGVHFTKMGFSVPLRDDPLGVDRRNDNRLWLLPEEIIYLLERGTLDVRWPAVDDEMDGDGFAMSLQGAYAMLIGDGENPPASLTLERYSVYAGLKRSGYTVLRSPSWSSPGPYLSRESFPPRPPRTWDVGLLEAMRWWYTLFSKTDEIGSTEHQEGPLVPPRLYRSYADIYRRLTLINCYDPMKPRQPPDDRTPRTDDSFRIAYHIWRPGSLTFKKSAPGAPDFRIAIVNARETSIPTLEQLDALLETVPYNPPIATTQLYQKLKHGYKDVVLAILDQGVVSYLRVADAAFGQEKLYERRGKGPGGKRGGRRGRGRGR